MINVNERYIFKVKECIAPHTVCDCRLEDNSCGLDEECVVLQKLKEETEKNKERYEWIRGNKMKKYALVRVDKLLCPTCEFKETAICCNTKFGCYGKQGDTKEQLVRKIEQGIEIGLKEVLGDDAVMLIRARKNHFTIARKIVEFLGVEE